MACFGMPKDTPEEKAARSAALQEATIYATMVPLRTMKAAFSAFPLVEAMAKDGNPNSVSDAGVGALCIRTAVHGAYLNVKINAAGIKDRAIADAILTEGAQIVAATDAKEKEIIEVVNRVIG